MYHNNTFPLSRARACCQLDPSALQPDPGLPWPNRASAMHPTCVRCGLWCPCLSTVWPVFCVCLCVRLVLRACSCCFMFLYLPLNLAVSDSLPRPVSPRYTLRI